MKRRLVVIKKASSGAEPPVITISAQPSNQSTSNGSTSFSVTASVTQGATLNYQWERSTDGGTNWSALSGETSSSLSLSALTVSSDQYKYRVVVSATGATPVTSSAATLSVVPVISISAQPANQSTSDGNATFSVTGAITLGGTLSYQWQRSTDGGTNYSNLLGQTSSSLSLSSLTVSSDQYRYRCVVSGSNGATSVTSNAATLSVVPEVSISSQPSNQTESGGAATFSVTASITLGATLNYQWERSTDGGSNWSNVEGATSASVALSGLTATSNNYQYRCVVGGSNGALSVLSDAATLTVFGYNSAKVSFTNGVALKNGYAWGWGSNNALTAGTGNVSSPVSITITNSPWSYIDVGPAVVGVLNYYSYAYMWGQNNFGVVGNNTTGTASYSTPQSVVGGRRWKQLSLGTNFATPGLHCTAALDLDGYAFTWGVGINGVLGTNQTGTARASSPVSVVGGRQFLVISNGGTFQNGGMLALDTNSYAYAWGTNTGDGTGAPRSSPVSVSGGRQWRQIARSGSVSCGLDSNSYAWTWGATATGLLGTNSTLASAFSPVSVVGGRQWRKIAVSLGNVLNSHTFVALDTNSYAYAWGANNFGQLGTSSGNASSPVSVVGGRQFDDIWISSGAVIARSGSEYYVWGYNSGGILGNSSTAALSSPALNSNLPYGA